MRWLASSLLTVSLSATAQGWDYRDFWTAGECASAYLHSNYELMERVEAEAKRQAITFLSKDDVWDMAVTFTNAREVQHMAMTRYSEETGTKFEVEAATQARVKGCEGYAGRKE